MREIYETTCLNLCADTNTTINSNYGGWSGFDLLLEINKLLKKHNCIPFTINELQEITSKLN